MADLESFRTLISEQQNEAEEALVRGCWMRAPLVTRAREARIDGVLA